MRGRTSLLHALALVRAHINHRHITHTGIVLRYHRPMQARRIRRLEARNFHRGYIAGAITRHRRDMANHCAIVGVNFSAHGGVREILSRGYVGRAKGENGHGRKN